MNHWIKDQHLKGKMTQRAIADEFGVTDATVRDIFSGKSRANVTGVTKVVA